MIVINKYPLKNVPTDTWNVPYDLACKIQRPNLTIDFLFMIPNHKSFDALIHYMQDKKS